MSTWINIDKELDMKGELKLEFAYNMEEDVSVKLDLCHFLDIAKAFGFAVIRADKEIENG